MEVTARIRRNLAASMALVVTSLACASTALAQDYPNRNVVMVVGFTAGGATDQAGRMFARELAKLWGRQVTIENKTGAGGNIGTAAVAKAPADGYTLIFASPSHAIGTSLYKKLPFDPVRDFAPIARVAEYTSIMVVNSKLPFTSVKQVIEYAAKNPEKLNVASGGNGAASHLGYEMFRQLTDTRYTHVPYGGTAEGLKDLLSGRVDMTFDSLMALLPHIQSGVLRPLAVGGTTRAPLLPDIPTIAESGVPGYEAVNWFGVLAPVGTPPEVVAKINRDLNTLMRDPAVQEALAKIGMAAARPNTPDEFRAYLKNEIDRYAVIVKKAGISLD